MIPGELFPAEGEIELNTGLETIALEVANTGDRPIQVGSHYHFFETNEGLSFDRERAAACAWIFPQAQPFASNPASPDP